MNSDIPKENISPEYQGKMEEQKVSEGEKENEKEEVFCPTKQEAADMIKYLRMFVETNETTLLPDIINLQNKFNRLCLYK